MHPHPKTCMLRSTCSPDHLPVAAAAAGAGCWRDSAHVSQPRPGVAHAAMHSHHGLNCTASVLIVMRSLRKCRDHPTSCLGSVTRAQHASCCNQTCQHGRTSTAADYHASPELHDHVMPSCTGAPRFGGYTSLVCTITEVWIQSSVVGQLCVATIMCGHELSLVLQVSVFNTGCAFSQLIDSCQDLETAGKAMLTWPIDTFHVCIHLTLPGLHWSNRGDPASLTAAPGAPSCLGHLAATVCPLLTGMCSSTMWQ